MSSAIIVGDPEPRSAVWRAARLLVTTVTGSEPSTQIDLAEIGAPLFASGDETVSDAVAAISDCNFLVVASPVVRGSYSGLLKLFLDRIPAGALARVTAVPLMVGSDPRHCTLGLPDAFLRPVLAELGARTPSVGSLFLLESELSSPIAIRGWTRRERHRLPSRLDLLAVTP